MQFYFIRHGQSQNNVNWDRHGDGYPRVEDPELTEVGQEQVALLAQFLSRHKRTSASGDGWFKNVDGFSFTHLYTSLMVRCLETSKAIADALEMPVVAWRDVHEVGGIFLDNAETGEPEGLPGNDRAYLEQRYPDLILPGDLDHGGWWNRPFEERPERLPRAQRFLQELLSRHGDTGDRVAVVSHGGFYNYFLWAVLGVPRPDNLWFMINNAAITRVDFAERVGVIYTNRTDFLPADLVT